MSLHSCALTFANRWYARGDAHDWDALSEENVGLLLLNILPKALPTPLNSTLIVPRGGICIQVVAHDASTPRKGEEIEVCQLCVR